MDPQHFDQRHQTGPFDLIGDVHGCVDELRRLLRGLGYVEDEDWHHPDGRMAVYLGDIVDRGPDVPGTITIVSSSVRAGNALFVPGNHDERFTAFLRGGNVDLAWGLEQTVLQIEQLDGDVRTEVVERFLDLYSNAPPYLWLDGGDLVAAHAGIEDSMIGRFDAEVWQFCLVGRIDVSEDGVRRLDWAPLYHGDALVAYGHTPCAAAEIQRNTVNLDQGCVFGGALSALRYPERTLCAVRSARPYFVPPRATR
jgi:protein phosphatase